MTVLYSILCLYVVSLIEPKEVDAAEVSYTTGFSNQIKCKLPKPPEHGSYTSSPAAEPGETLDSVQLNVTCKLGYKLTGDGIVSCSHGQWTQPMPKCRQFCMQNGRALLFFSHCVFASGEIFSRNGEPYSPYVFTNESNSETGDKCILPPFPIYGTYVSIPPGSPGDTFDSFELSVTCKSGREVVGSRNISCASGKLSNTMPFCLAPCTPVGNDAAILACEDVLDSIERNVNSTSTVKDATTEINKTTANTEGCVLPPWPQNGRYTSFPAEPPGTTTSVYQVNVTCAPDYHLVGQKSVKCVFGLVEGEMPVCVPYCKVEKQTTVTCGEQEHQCILRNADELLLTTRNEELDEECGLVVVGRRRRLPVSAGFTPAPREFPWHTGIYKMIRESRYQQICGGTLISKSVVITAAHCFTPSRQLPSPSLYGVAVGKRYRRWHTESDAPVQKSKVKDIKIPPRYQGAEANFQEDIAIVIVVEEFEYNRFVRPACISFDPKFDEKQLEPGNMGKIAGWGLTDEEGANTRLLQAAYLPYIAVDKCIEDSPISFRSSITADKICAGYDNGTSACHGDSGGGFVVGALRNGETRYYLHGVISTSPANDRACNVYTWITLTHILRHEHFIKSVALGLS